MLLQMGPLIFNSTFWEGSSPMGFNHHNAQVMVNINIPRLDEDDA
jgi:hypothetical protein